MEIHFTYSNYKISLHNQTTGGVYDNSGKTTCVDWPCCKTACVIGQMYGVPLLFPCTAHDKGMVCIVST